MTVIWNRSRPRGAGPSWYSPAPLYFEPWHGHSNHFEDVAERHAAAEVHAPLVQRHDPVGGDALGRVVGLPVAGRPVPRHEVEATGPVVDAAAALCELGLDVGERARRRSSTRTRPVRFGHRNAIVPRPNSAPNSRTDVSSDAAEEVAALHHVPGPGPASSPAAARFACLRSPAGTTGRRRSRTGSARAATR